MCCKNEAVYLFPEQGDDPSVFKTKEVKNPITGRAGLQLLQQPNGDCIHLVDGNCEVWGQHPVMCRTFSCARYYASKTRAERRRIEKTLPGGKEIFARGREVFLAQGGEE